MNAIRITAIFFAAVGVYTLFFLVDQQYDLLETDKMISSHILPNCKPETKCPYDLSFKESCRNRAESVDTPYFPLQQIDEDEFIDNLLSFFNGKRVALVGDSLSRQWFEMLSCRLGMVENYFEVNNDLPIRLQQLQKAGINVPDLGVSPKGFKSTARGYAQATTPDVNNIDMECHSLNSTLEYYHFDKVQSSSDINIIDFVGNYSDIVVTNIGLHYFYETDKRYEKDMKDIFKSCGAMNDNREEPKCLFRETTPQHFLYDGDDLNNNTGAHDKFRNKGSCGPITNMKMNPSVMKNFVAQRYSRKYNVPLVRVESSLRNAWMWHVDKDTHKYKVDCTHYCQDNEIWDIFHSALIRSGRCGNARFCQFLAK